MTVSHQLADEYGPGIHVLGVPFVLMICLTAGAADAREIGPGLGSEPRCCSDRLVAATIEVHLACHAQGSNPKLQ